MPPSSEKPSIRGRFITFEGIDGCGKTTQARRLAERLRTLRLPVTETREPGGTPIGRELRRTLLNPEHAAMAPQCELLLYLADRVQHLREVVAPALERGEVVICDRFHDATVAYQHYGRGLDFSLLEGFIAAEVHTATPELTFWLDLDVSAAQGRMNARSREGHAPGLDESRLDRASAAFHERVRAGYAAICAGEPQRFVRVDAAPDEDSVHIQVWASLEQRYHVL